jgi:hypothetical protein
MLHLRKSPEMFKKPSMLPGFQNAFVDLTPSRPSQRRGGKGKQRDIEDAIDDTNYQNLVSLPSSPARCEQDMDIDFKMETQHLLENDITIHIPNRDVDVEMAEEPGSASEKGENVDKIEPFDWKTEVYLSLICFWIMLMIALVSAQQDHLDAQPSFLQCLDIPDSSRSTSHVNIAHGPYCGVCFGWRSRPRGCR